MKDTSSLLRRRSEPERKGTVSKIKKGKTRCLRKKTHDHDAAQFTSFKTRSSRHWSGGTGRRTPPVSNLRSLAANSAKVHSYLYESSWGLLGSRWMSIVSADVRH